MTYTNLTKADPDRATDIARKACPTIYQGYGRYVDVPTKLPVRFSREGTHEPLWAMGDIHGTPTLYYWVMLFGGDKPIGDVVMYHRCFYYVGFMAYHPFDYTDCLPGKLIPGAEHLHDCEGFILEVPYYLPHHKPTEPTGIITVAHNKLHIHNGYGAVRIEAGSHAIKPLPYMNHCPQENTLVIHHPRLLSLYSVLKDQETWEAYRVGLEPANLPDEWADEGKYKGMFLHDPHSLFDATRNT